MGGRKTTRLSPKSAGIGAAAYRERGGIDDLCTSVSTASPSNGMKSGRHRQAAARSRRTRTRRKQNQNFRVETAPVSYGGSTEGRGGGALAIERPVASSGDYTQILSNELSISVPPPPPPVQPFQLSNRFFITFCTSSQGAGAKTNA